MIVGTCLLRLHLSEARSLKDKRQVVTSLMTRLRTRFGVSVAELDEQETWQLATLGVACVSASETVCRRLLDNLVAWTERAGPFEVLEASIEIR